MPSEQFQNLIEETETKSITLVVNMTAHIPGFVQPLQQKEPGGFGIINFFDYNFNITILY
jgi:hypothetical protein